MGPTDVVTHEIGCLVDVASGRMVGVGTNGIALTDPQMFSHVIFKHRMSCHFESSPGGLHKIQNSIGGVSVHYYIVSSVICVVKYICY